MKFLEFFDTLKQKRLSRESKDLIFQRFEAKKRHGLFIQKVNRFARVWVLSLFILWGLAVVYMDSFSNQWQGGEWEFNEGFIWFNADDAAQVVYADDIWTIITTVGEVTISNNWVKKSWTWLAHADKVLLLAWAELTFAMQWWVQAKIVWPAEFNIEKENDVYVINMLSGEFVQLKTVEEVKEEVLTEKEFVTNKPATTKTIEPSSVQVVVKTAEFEVSSDSTLGEIDMTITEKDGKQIVENSGADVVITKLIKDEKVVTSLKTKQKASINGEVHIAMITPDLDINEEQAEQLVETIKNNDLTISYKTEPTIPTKEEAAIEEEKEQDVVKEEKVVPSDNAPVVDQEKPLEQEDKEEPVVPEIPLVEGKRVIGWADLAALQNATHGSVLMRDISNLVTSHAYGYQPGVQTSLINMSSSLRPVSQNILWGMNLDSSSPVWMASSIQSMINNLEAKWYVPPVYVNRLKSVIAWLRLMQTIPSGSVEASCNFDCIVTDVLQIQSSQKSRLMLQ